MAVPAINKKAAGPAKGAGKKLRKERILSTARELIAKNGVANLRVRELADEAGVATATLYNLFGGKYGVVAQALKEDFVLKFMATQEEESLLSPSERVQSRVSASARDVPGLREYTGAVMHYYFNNDDNTALRQVMHDAVKRFFVVVLQDIDELGDLQNWVNMDALADDVVSSIYAVLLKWVQGHLAQDQLEFRLLMVSSMPFIAGTKGDTRKAFEQIVIDHTPPD